MEQSETRVLRGYLRAISARRRLILTAALAAAAAAVLFSILRSPTYEAKGTVVVSADFNQGQALTTTPGAAAAEAAALGTRNDVLTLASRSLGGDPTVSKLRDDVSTSPQPGVNIVDVTAKASSASQTVREANAVARAMQTVASQEQARNLNELAANATDPARATFLRQQAATTQPIQIGRVPKEPSSPTSPKPIRDAIFAALLGLLLGVAIALVRAAMDRRVDDVEEMQSDLGLPLLGYVRADALGVQDVPQNGTGAVAANLESFRILRANAEHLGGDRDLRTIAITSPLSEEGKSLVVSWYAYVSALAGRETILIECDLRRPAMAERFALDPLPGLSDHLLGEAKASEVLRSVAVEGPMAQPLPVIPAGSPTAQPSELLGSSRFDRFLAEVSEAYEHVILECPPLLPVGDTLSMLPKVDGVILCVRIGQTTRDEAKAARAAMDRMPARPTGLVVTGVPHGTEGDYVGHYPALASGTGTVERPQ
jgi:capsular exopolysaccharide synthesis family protein